MNRRLLFLVLCIGCVQHLQAAPVASFIKGDTLEARVRTLRAVCAHVDTLTTEEAWSDTTSVAHRVATAIMDVLRVPGLTDQRIDSIFSDLLVLNHARSADGRLHVFSIPEMTGGTYQSNAHVVFHRTAAGTGIAWAPSDDGALLCGGAWYNAIHRVQQNKSSSVYVCIGTTIGCATCIADVIQVIELGPQSINYEYPAFAAEEPQADKREEALDEEGDDEAGEEDEPEHFTSCRIIDMRFGDGILFEYDPDRRTFTYAYRNLDPDADHEGQQMKVSGTITWNGRYFVGREEE